jgi:hypothetical protein
VRRSGVTLVADVAEDPTHGVEQFRSGDERLGQDAVGTLDQIVVRDRIAKESEFSPAVYRRDQAPGLRPLEPVQRCALVQQLDLVQGSQHPLHEKVVEPRKPGGQRLARLPLADGEITAEAIAKGDVQAINYFVAQKYVEALKDIATSPNQKVFMMPVDATGILGAIAGIAELTKERLRRAGRKIKEENPMFSSDTGFRVFKLDSTNIREWDPNRENLAESLEASVDHLKTNRTEQDILFELLLKLGLDLCVPMEQRTIAGKTVHSIGAGVLITCLDKSITRADAEPLALGILALLKELKTAGDTTLVFRDSAFADEVAKTNLSKILEQNGIAAKNIRSI